MKPKFAGTWPCILASMLLSATAAAGTNALCQAKDPLQRKQCQDVLSSLIPAVVFDDETGQFALAERMSHYQVPAVSIAVIDQGRIAWRAAYGQRQGDGAPITTQTVFQAASISKPVAATLAMLLVQSGNLKLDVPVNAQLHSWQLPASGKLQPTAVTLRGLLSHSAGINVHGFPGYAGGAPLPNEIQVLDGKAPANSPPIRLVSKPGTYRYSGGGYQIIELMIEDALGKPFAELAQKRLLSPLGMRHTAFSAELPKRFAANVATGHDYAGMAIPGGWIRYPELAAASLWSTPSDLAHYLVAMMKPKHGASHALLTPHTTQLMLTPVVEGMGLGLGVHGEGKNRIVDQAGDSAGYKTYLAGYPNRGQGVIIMTNGDGGKMLIREICRSLARAWGWPDFAGKKVTAAAIDAKTLDRRSGEFKVREYGFTLKLQRRGKTLFATTPRGSSFTYRPLTPWSFIAEEDASELVFDQKNPDHLQVWGMHAERIVPPNDH